ncbi:MAG: hypothetical protein LHV69_01530 [Elusimicrobia bacterium]|nr:hypothetical protein [Candidatus Obscuribacterium magneticum]
MKLAKDGLSFQAEDLLPIFRVARRSHTPSSMLAPRALKPGQNILGHCKDITGTQH